MAKIDRTAFQRKPTKDEIYEICHQLDLPQRKLPEQYI
jgi:hypothetical protein